MRFIDPSTYAQSWTQPTSTALTVSGAATTTVSGGYTIYTFTATGNTPVTIRGRGAADILFVAGGGGAAGLGGGGGAGGYIFRQNVLLQGGTDTNPAAPQNYVTVGAGGIGPTNNSHGPFGESGTPSKLVIDGVTVVEAIGGGGGGNWNGYPADRIQANGLYTGLHTPLSLSPASPFPSQYGPGHAGGRGGSGGGGSGNPTNTPGGSAVLGQGHPGGYGHHPNHYKGGGGGGAGEAGGNTNPGWPSHMQHTAGSGGDGLMSDITGTQIHYAGGGGGANHHPAVHNGAGSRGGGTTGGAHSPDHGNLAPATGCLPNTGAGAGAGNNPQAQGAGGPGIVVIRVNNNQLPLPAGLRKFSPTGSSV